MTDRIEIVYADITTLSVDAIVNAANERLLGGGGLDGAIHRAAGSELLRECARIGGCPTGEARVTKGYNLPARHVIHTVGPVFSSYPPEQACRLLMSAYQNSLLEAEKLAAETVAFAGISVGVYGFPMRPAARIAAHVVMRFLETREYPKKVIFAVFDSAWGEALHEVFR